MRSLLLAQLLKALIVALIVVTLYGSLPTGRVLTLLALFIVLRVFALGAESLRRMPGRGHWHAMTEALTGSYTSMADEHRAIEAASMGMAIDSSPRAMSEAAVREAMRPYENIRPVRMLFADGVGLATYALLLPLIAGIYSSDFFSLRRREDWIGICVGLLGVLLYAWPHVWTKTALSNRRKILWWALPFLPAVFLAVAGIVVRHPYLNPLDPERTRLAAERILALPDGVTSGAHADWVLDYAHLLHEKGDRGRAAHFAREALRLDAGSSDAAELLQVLTSSPLAESSNTVSPVASNEPYWSPGQIIPAAQRGTLGASLEQLDEHTVVIVAVGEVQSELLDAVAWVIQRELSMPCVVVGESLPLPVHSRIRGLVFGKQWEDRSLLMAFQRANQPPPTAPLRYLLITAADIYSGNSNFVFSVANGWGVIASYAQYAQVGDGPNNLRHRLAKLCLGSIIKSFGMPASHERSCVTSYTRSISEFDSKGNRPSRATLDAFRAHVDMGNRVWLNHKRQRRQSAQ